MINQVILVGRTTKNIELRQTKSGTNYVQFTLAVNRAYKGSEQQADFINCVAWCKTAETMAQYVFKGTLIGIEGRLQVRTYQNGSPALSSGAISNPQLAGNEAGIRQYISEVLVNRFFFLEARKNSATPEPMEPTYLQAPSENSNSSTSNQHNNYNNPFITATTLAGGLHSSVPTISIQDDDLPF